MIQVELPTGLKLVIFDCDGVLIDSEGPSCCETAYFARKHGIAISDEESLARFAGKALPQVAKELEQLAGYALPPDTVDQLRQRQVMLMEKRAAPVDGALKLLKDLIALHVPVRVGSNSSHAEMSAKFGRTGMNLLLPTERIHSANDRGRPKPDPDVYLYAAQVEGVRPEEAVVIEDSDTGAEAARRAGMSCILLRPEGHSLPSCWPVKGFVHVTHLSEVFPLLRPCLCSKTGAVL